MRESKREAALEAAKHVVQRDGVTALSYESVAAEAGLTKGGLLYHFPTREDLLLALHEYVAGQWEQHMRDEVADEVPDTSAPGPDIRGTAPLTEAAKTVAYVRASQNPDRAELLLTLEAISDQAARAVWNGVYDRWAAPVPESAEDHDAVARFIARLAADGLWLYESISEQPMHPQIREHLVRAIIALDRSEQQ
ncbi:TetR/AcrR family transcriptional regulator [Nesterenkonia ebinurensis]|uniref:TetR/AcrR family transcriptional regulator n=1 Tax=Nesterenkonia ebinurensis TaxID=2608252 RepID=UPI00123DA466|nr:TetR/AcrR family transcriptional regulator [Nesterenkonia ebinurensis]